jgi:subtilase family serine protease
MSITDDPMRVKVRVLSLLAMTFACSVPVLAQAAAAAPSLITQSINENNLVTLPGTVRTEMTPANDLGPVSDTLQLNHMYLLLNRSAAQESAAEELVEQLHDNTSPLYHQWLTADQIAAQFGPAAGDVSTVTNWLVSHGFTVHTTYAANGVIDFSGPASAIASAFHTQIHNLSVKGRHHIANASNLSIPAALAPAVQGVVSMSDFMPHPMLQPRKNYTISSTLQALVPGDLQTIYNINPLYARGVSGQGQTIVVVEDTDLFTTANWFTFRQTLGLTQRFPQATLSQVHPQPSGHYSGGAACADPGINGDDGEAAVDVEWSSAAAPSAAIVLASCADTNTNFGGFIAMQNMLTGRGRPPAIFSISYGSPESFPPPSNAYVFRLYQLAVLQGVTIFVSSGDSGADATDQFAPAATSGLNVSGFATTPYNVAVGGTDFADTFLGTVSTYWNTTNSADFSSAKSYIPEIPWNDSCAGALVTKFLGFPQTFGPNSFCNSTEGAGFLIVAAGSGGPSSCATGTPEMLGVVGGTCRGYPKPSFQRGIFGNPNDGVRDIPDVSLFASNGFWGHYYVFCYSDPTPNFGGAPCTGAPSTWAGAGGTSFAAPIMAGIQALINETSESYQGNPDYVYYALAELSRYPSSSCNSTLGNKTSPQCVFYDVTMGDDDVNCLPLVLQNGVTVGSFDCFFGGGTNGVLSTSTRSYQPAYVAGRGYDYPTGIGSVNAFNLAKSWPGSRLRY